MQDRTAIRERLLDMGLTVNDWARQNGYSTIYIHQLLTRYGCGVEPKIRSPKAWAVIKKLYADTGINLLSVNKG